MATINLHDAKTHLSRLVDRAAQGEEIVIARAGKPVARLVAFQPKTGTRKLGLYAGQIKLDPSFDQLPPDIQAAFAGEDE